jgi:hypothetical protein
MKRFNIFCTTLVEVKETMKLQVFSMEKQTLLRRATLVLGLAFLGLLAGCGGSSANQAVNPSPTPANPNPPAPGASADVVVLLSSTANDQLVAFTMAITSVTLSDGVNP